MDTKKVRVKRSREQVTSDATIAAREIISSLKNGGEPTPTTMAQKLRQPKASLLRDIDALMDRSDDDLLVSAIGNWRRTFTNKMTNDQRRAVVDLAFEIKDSVGRWSFDNNTEMAFAMGLPPFTLNEWVRKFRGSNASIYFSDKQRFEDDPEGLLTDALSSHVTPLPRDDTRAMAMDMLTERLEQIRNMD